jgi:uncharacterized LabA/DUF88 family protein
MKNKYLKTYAFIDGQNLNLSVSKNIYKNKKLEYKGWKLDYKKFRIFLKDKFRVNKVFYFIGKIKGNEKLYANLKSYGYDLVFKSTVKDSDGKPKGNVDAELVLHASAIEYNHFDKAIIVAGDGDYCCLIKYLEQKKKLFKIIIPNAKSESTLLKEFQKYKMFVNHHKDKLEYIKK